jgi:dCTP deaminase
VIDPAVHQPDLTEEIVVPDGEAFILHPGQFALGTTLERIAVPNDILGKLEGKSTLGRLGLMIHSTAGYVDPGWDGELTLELSNVATLPIMLRPGMRIGQMSFERMTSPVERPYGSAELGSHYQGQRGATPSCRLSD